MSSTVKVVPFASLQRWDVKNVLTRTWRRTPEQLAPFGEVAVRRIEPNSGGLRYGSVHFNGKITQRPESKVIQGATYVARPNDVVFSRIDVRNGAIGVMPDYYGPLAFTNEYPIYDVKATGKILPEYVQILCRTDTFRSQIQALVVGHSGRKRVSAENFERFLIPLPSKSEQKYIVDRYQAAFTKAQELREEAEARLQSGIAAITEILGLSSPDVSPIEGTFAAPSHALERWSVFNATAAARGISDELTSRYEVRPLGDPEIAKVNYGIQKSPRNRPDAHPRPYLRVANVQDGYLDLREVKCIEVADDQMDALRLEPGDVLLCEGNSAELVGRPALWQGEIKDCVHQNHVLKVRANTNLLLPEYLLAYMQTKPSRGHFRRRAKKTTNLATISSSDVRELRIPVPPIDTQREVGQFWSETRKEAHELNQDSERLEKEVTLQVEKMIVEGL
ncbi:type I restriction enzyme, S subunit [Saccharopolyspora shandongensis]|uniref:Type I restriction enzyme, S subunit n=1 Tax=Saccharopolyspora shandongensis TaxID=418495 RepID=A0A1H3M367_9PSEU|nr:hypothetical protein [Saccharopolyspora shandongensis]SDY70718.1 type I restriction enzyme, S subunit [Saccharopolyspora shandongensis]